MNLLIHTLNHRKISCLYLWLLSMGPWFYNSTKLSRLTYKKLCSQLRKFQGLNRDNKVIDHPAWSMQPIRYAEWLLLWQLQGSPQGVQIFIFQRKGRILIIVLETLEINHIFYQYYLLPHKAPSHRIGLVSFLDRNWVSRIPHFPEPSQS